MRRLSMREGLFQVLAHGLRCFAVAMTAVAACGGTTGLEDIDGGMDAGAGDVVPVDASDADATTTSDATTAADGATGGDAAVDQAAFDQLALDEELDDGDMLDRALRTRPPAQDTGAPVADAAEADTAPEASVDAGPDPCRPTSDTLTCLRAHDKPQPGDSGMKCSACIVANGCLDTTQAGQPCEGIDCSGNGGDGGVCPHYTGALPDGTSCGGAGVGLSASETGICLRTLETIFTSTCASTLQLTPCLCGTADTAGCLAGTTTPLGAEYDLAACDIDTTSSTTIQGGFLVQSYGVGAANAIALCGLQSGCDCF